MDRHNPEFSRYPSDDDNDSVPLPPQGEGGLVRDSASDSHAPTHVRMRPQINRGRRGEPTIGDPRLRDIPRHPSARPEVKRATGPERVVVEELEESDSIESTVNRRPDARNLAEAVRAGRPISRIFSWFNGRATVTGTRDTVPPSATYRPAKPGEEATQQDKNPNMFWARLRIAHSAPSEKRTGDTENDEALKQTRIDSMVQVCGGLDFTIAVEANGVSAPEQSAAAGLARRREMNRAATMLDPKAPIEQARYAAEATTYATAAEGALATESIVIGTPRVEDLEYVAEQAARIVQSDSTSSTRDISVQVVRNEDDTVRVFETIDEAARTQRTVVTVDELADHLVLPKSPLPGLRRKSAPTDFDTERVVRPGQAKVAFGNIVNNWGVVTGEKLWLTREHTSIDAETEAGKTAALRHLGCEIQKGNAERARIAEELGEQTWDHEALIYVDCKKTGNYTHPLSKQLGGVRDEQGNALPEEMTKVSHLEAAGEGIGVRFDLFKPTTGSTPASWRKRIETAGVIVSSRYRRMEPDTYRTFKKNFMDSLDLALQKLGINPISGRSKYAYGRPSSPTGEFVANQSPEVVRRGAQQVTEHTSDMAGWMGGEQKSNVRGDSGAIFSSVGSAFNGVKALDNEGVTSIDLRNIRDVDARQVAVLATLFEVFDACVAKNEAAGVTSTSKIHATMVVDEADIFSGEIGEAIGEFFSHMRDQGLRVVYARQGNREGVAMQARINTPNKIMMRSTHDDDLTDFAKSAGKTTREDMQAMTAAPQGMGALKGPNMPRAVRFQIPNPDDPNETPMSNVSWVEGPEALINRDLDMDDLELFNREVEIEAREYLVTDQLGVAISNWAEMNAVLIASGRSLCEVSGDLAEELITSTEDPLMREKIRCAIVLAVKNSVESRPDIQYNNTPDLDMTVEYRKHMTEHMLAMADGTFLPGWDDPRPDLGIDVATKNTAYNPNGDPGDENTWKRYHVEIDGTFGSAKDRIREQMTAEIHPHTQTMEHHLGKEIKAENANEQFDAVNRMAQDAVNNVSNVVFALAAHNAPTPQAYQALANDIVMLVAGEILEEAANENYDPEIAFISEAAEPHIRAKAVSVIEQYVNTYNGITFTKEQRSTLADIIDETPITSLIQPWGYSNTLAVLKGHIEDQQEQAAAVPLNELLNDTLIAKLRQRSNDTVAFDSAIAKITNATTAKEQKEIIERELEQPHLANVLHARRINPSQILFGMDMQRGGVTIDNNTAFTMRQTKPPSPLEQAARAANSVKPEQDYTLGGMIRSGDWTPYRRAFQGNYVYSDNMLLPVGTRQYVVETYSHHITDTVTKVREEIKNEGVIKAKRTKA